MNVAGETEAIRRQIVGSIFERLEIVDRTTIEATCVDGGPVARQLLASGRVTAADCQQVAAFLEAHLRLCPACRKPCRTQPECPGCGVALGPESRIDLEIAPEPPPTADRSPGSWRPIAAVAVVVVVVVGLALAAATLSGSRSSTGDRAVDAEPAVVDDPAAGPLVERVIALRGELDGCRQRLDEAVWSGDRPAAERLRTEAESLQDRLRVAREEALAACNRTLAGAPDRADLRAWQRDLLQDHLTDARRRRDDDAAALLRGLVEAAGGDPRVGFEARLEIASTGPPLLVRRRRTAPDDWIDLGRTPVSIALDPGRHLLRLVADDGRRLDYPIRLDPGDRLRLEATIPSDPVPGMCHVPGGVVAVGGDRLALDPLPRHRVRVATFWIDPREVTVGDYARFLADLDDPAAALRHRSTMTDRAGRDLFVVDGDRIVLRPGSDSWRERPIVGVTWSAARAFAAWRSIADDRTLDLPTEIEWEAAARGADERPFPWGDDTGPLGRLSSVDGAVGSSPVDRSPWGALDLAGGAAEWTATDGGGGFRIVRGGGGPLLARSASRRALDPGQRYADVGFRLVHRPDD